MSGSGHTSGSEIRVVALLVREECLADTEVEMMGSEIKRRLGIGPGTLYPILARLREGGLLLSRAEEGSPRDLGRPAGNLWQVTTAGEDWLRAWLESAGLTLAPVAGPRSGESVPDRPWRPTESLRTSPGPEPDPREWASGLWLLVRLSERGAGSKSMTPAEQIENVRDCILDSLGYPDPDRVDVDVRLAGPAGSAME